MFGKDEVRRKLLEKETKSPKKSHKFTLYQHKHKSCRIQNITIKCESGDSLIVDCLWIVLTLKEMEQIKDKEKLRAVLPQCFRGSALIWHSTKLCETKKMLLQPANLVYQHGTRLLLPSLCNVPH